MALDGLWWEAGVRRSRGRSDALLRDDARMHLRGLYALYDSEYRYVGRA